MHAHLELVSRRLLDELPSDVFDAAAMLARDVGIALPVSVVGAGVQGARCRVCHSRRRHEA